MRWAFAFFLWATATAAADTRLALVIGNSAYREVGALANAGADAQLVADALRSDGFEVSLVRDAPRADMLKSLKAFGDRVEDADWALVYYAGHGVEIGGVNYLLPVDAQLREDRDAQDEAVSLNRVLETVESARKMRIVILDACRNNPFVSTMKRSVRVRAVERGLAPVEPVSGTMVVYAAAAGQVAEDGADGHSPFAAALVRRIVEPGLELSRLFNVVAADVLSATGRHQRPFLYGSNPTREEFYFKPPAPVAATAAPLAGFWEVLKGSGDAATLRAFRDRLPAGDALRQQVEARIAEIEAAKPVAQPKVAAIAPPAPRIVAATPATPNDCDRLAGSDFDPDLPKGFPSVDPAHFRPEAAIVACRAALEAAPGDRRLHYQLARAFYYAKSYEAARLEYARAAAAGSAAGMAGLGYLYEQGQGGPKAVDVARDWHEKAAKAGSPFAMNRLNAIYRTGMGVSANLDVAQLWATAARLWAERAAADGNVDAMAMLGQSYASGYGVNRDTDAARIWFEKAAAGGNGNAMFGLGRLDAEAATPDFESARSWYAKAAEAGNVPAMKKLAKLYEDGSGGPTDLASARALIEKAARSGDADAMNTLGFMYEFGKGGAKSDKDARDWYEKAAAAGDAGAKSALDRLNATKR